jgi:hypothetical protein
MLGTATAVPSNPHAHAGPTVGAVVMGVATVAVEVKGLAAGGEAVACKGESCVSVVCRRGQKQLFEQGNFPQSCAQRGSLPRRRWQRRW